MSPACDAVNEHVPAFTIVMMNVPEATVHTAVSFDESVTVSDELAVGDTANPTDDQLRPAGATNEMFCDAWETVIDCVAEARPGDEYVIVWVPGVTVKPRSSNVTTPDVGVRLPVPTTVPPVSDAVTVADDVVTTLLPASCTLTTGWVANAWP